MSEYPKVIERPYKIYTGSWITNKYFPEGKIVWSYDRSFWLESDAAAYAERESEDYEFVKIEYKENN